MKTRVPGEHGMRKVLEEIWFRVFDRPRCAMCHTPSRPSQLVCSDACGAKLEVLALRFGVQVEGAMSGAGPEMQAGKPRGGVFPAGGRRMAWDVFARDAGTSVS